MQDVARNGVDVSLGVADGIMVLDPQQAQEHLLHEIGHVRHLAHAGRQEPAQLLAVRFFHRGQEGGAVRDGHGTGSLRTGNPWH